MGENIMQYMRAFYGFERPNMRSLVSDPQARISKGLVFRKAQASLTNSRLTGQFNRTLSNSGFFAPIECRASSDISEPTMRGCRKEYRNYAGVMPAPLQRIYRLGFGNPQYTQCDHGGQFWL